MKTIVLVWGVACALSCGVPPKLIGNPFRIDFPVKKELSTEDYIEIQQKLRAVEIAPLVDGLYPSKSGSLLPFRKSPFAKKEDFQGRICKSLVQTLIDPDKGLLPVRKLVTVGKGGDNCIVCYASFNGRYVELLKELPKTLEKVGFNGHLLYRIGGFPNPTGREIAYCGVPYGFKIFSILEANLLGFQKVLWIDSALHPLKDPTPLFDWIDKAGCYIKGEKPQSGKFILPRTLECLKTLTGVDVRKVKYISAQVIGFDFRRPQTAEFLRKYYEMTEAGLPFLSCFPEEFVFTAIAGGNPEDWPSAPYRKICFSEAKLKGKTADSIQNPGCFFLQKEH